MANRELPPEWLKFIQDNEGKILEYFVQKDMKALDYLCVDELGVEAGYDLWAVLTALGHSMGYLPIYWDFRVRPSDIAVEVSYYSIQGFRTEQISIAPIIIVNSPVIDSVIEGILKEAKEKAEGSSPVINLLFKSISLNDLDHPYSSTVTILYRKNNGEEGLDNTTVDIPRRVIKGGRYA